MRNRHIVTYDITDDKRRTKVFKILLGFGDHLQYSVFRCDLSRKERVLLIEAVDKVINHRKDQVMIVDLGPSEGRADKRVTALGLPYVPAERGVVVV
jgi:CRISPR-associated protein Cas2